MPETLTLHRTQRVGDREYAYLYRVSGGELRWYYMPTGTAQMYGACVGSIDWLELGRRYGVSDV